MPTFQILDAGTLIATAIAPSIDAPATSMDGGEEFFSAYSGLVKEGEVYLSPGQYARLLGGNGSGSVREVDADGHVVAQGPLEQDETEIYIACLTVWAYWEKEVRTVPVAVLSVQELDKPAREAVPIIDSGIYILMADQFRNDPRGITEVAQDLGLSLMEPHSGHTVFGGEIYEENSARAVAKRFGAPRRRPAGTARRVLRRD